jgi:transcriptional regulator with XRE-family HTH domain
MTQGDVASAVAESVGRRHTDAVVRGWEQGHRNPQLHDIIAIADLFGISVDYLVGRVDSPDLIVVRDDGNTIAVEIKGRRAAQDRRSVLDAGAAGAEQVAALDLGPDGRTPRTPRAVDH